MAYILRQLTDRWVVFQCRNTNEWLPNWKTYEHEHRFQFWSKQKRILISMFIWKFPIPLNSGMHVLCCSLRVFESCFVLPRLRWIYSYVFHKKRNAAAGNLCFSTCWSDACCFYEMHFVQQAHLPNQNIIKSTANWLHYTLFIFISLRSMFFPL